MALPVSSLELSKRSAPLGGVDPDVKVPRAVREAGERAALIQRASLGEAEPPVTPPAETPTPPVETPSTPPVETPTPPQPTPAPQAQAPVPAGQEDWEWRYNAMKGRYEKLVNDTAGITDQMARMQTEIASLRAQAPQPNGHDRQPVTLLTEKEIEDYGPEFIDVVRRAAAELTGPLQDEVKQLRGQLGHVQAESGNAFVTRMNATVGGLVPSWQSLNKDARFIEWTGLPEVYSGVKRQLLMQEAWNNGDANRVAAFFQAFLAEEAAVDPQRRAAQAPAGLPTPLGTPTPPQASLEQFVAPGRAHSSAQTPADKPVYTAQDITRFYRDVVAGRWRTREAERAAIDADIISAQHEGRIIPDNRTIQPHGFNGGR